MDDHPFSPPQRLWYAIGAAALVHAGIIAGLEFRPPDNNSSPAMPALEIVLSTTGIEIPPDEDAEYFGVENQRGGGNTADNVRPVLPEPDQMPSPGQDLAGDDHEPPSPLSGSENKDLVATRDNPEQKVFQDLRPEQPRSMAAARRALTLAPLARSRQPRERFLSVNTRQTLFAGYLADWKTKVERVGTLNFPDEARRLSMEGSPVLEVALRSDGSLAEIQIRRSSGERALDQAAIRILRLASPFDPFPRDLTDRYQILRFAYEWRFVDASLTGQASSGR
jgi:protein TonB